jgi:hypothetical protein
VVNLLYYFIGVALIAFADWAAGGSKRSKQKGQWPN